LLRLKFAKTTIKERPKNFSTDHVAMEWFGLKTQDNTSLAHWQCFIITPNFFYKTVVEFKTLLRPKKVFKDMDAEIFSIPAKSPGVNPIENIL